MNKLSYFSAEDVERLHKILVDIWKREWAWGMHWYMWWKNIKDIESILIFCKNDDYYKTLAEKAAYLMYSFNKNHIFLDWNKRISIYATMFFILMNAEYNYNCVVKLVNKLENVAVKVANDEINKDELLKIFKNFFSRNKIKFKK